MRWRAGPIRRASVVLTLVALVVVALAVTLFSSAEESDVTAGATATASSERRGQEAWRAIDGIGGPGTQASAEWVAAEGDRAPWIRLRWTTPQVLRRIDLFDLPSARDRVTRATLRFDTGVVLRIDALPNDGTRFSIRFEPQRVSQLTLTLDQVLPGTQRVGLAEVRLWRTDTERGDGSGPTPRSPDCPQGSVVNVVAHPDDDLLFINPTMLEDGWAGRCVLTLVLTAGDAGRGYSYWAERQVGLRAAYAAMGGVPSSWRNQPLVIAGNRVTVETLVVDHPAISLIFLRLPDGNLHGEGFAATGAVSVAQLWDGSVGAMTSVDSATFYTRADLVHAIRAVVDWAGATEVNTLDPRVTPEDHSDHRHTALFVNKATTRWKGNVAHYVGYGTSALPPNVEGAKLAIKKAAFYAYAAHDSEVCGSDEACGASLYGQWLSRRYRVER